jgi:glycosyltransferase involved in cell wall biosynthesis
MFNLQIPNMGLIIKGTKNNGTIKNININMTKYMITCAFIIIILIILVIKKNKYELFTNILIPKHDDVPKMVRPFLNIYDDKDNKVNVVFITHPFTREECIKQYTDAKKKGVHFIGMSSYCEFPSIISNPHDILHDKTLDAWTKYNYYDLSRGWCHCFKEPNKYIKDTTIPKTLISESDFANFDQHKPDPSIEKKYDFLYVCLKDNDKCENGWQAYNRNWDVAKKCLDIMCEKYNLKGLLIGRVNCQIPKGCHQLMELTDFMEYSKFIKTYNQCKFIFVPNFADASPRVLTEAICFNLPAIVNSNILGGWKYIDDKTGELFTDVNDFEDALTRLLYKQTNNEYAPRERYIANYGPKNAGKRLLDFICKCIPENELNFNKHQIQYLKPGI